MSSLPELRQRIDKIDDKLMRLLAERFDVCEQIGHLKQVGNLSTMQPNRVQEVLSRMSCSAAEQGVDSEFATSLWKLIIDEACRREDCILYALQGASQPPNHVTSGQSTETTALESAALRIDHVAIAVRDLEQAISHYRDQLGFRVTQRQTIDGEFSGMDSAVVVAGGVTLVLVQATDPRSNVALYINHYGPGVQHIALEVSALERVQSDLKQRGFHVLTDIIDGGQLRQLFSKRDANSGMQLEFVERGLETGFTKANATELFRAMERENVF
jgi:methylmalonyl-CoA epimerase